MAGQHGVKGLANLIVVGTKAIDGVRKVFADGKFSFDDIGPLIGLAQLLEPGIEAFKLASKEIGELDEEDRNALHGAVAEALDLPNDEVEHAIEDTLKAILSIYAIFV